MIFRESKAFSKRLAEFLTDEDLRLLQVSLLLKPDQGKVIPGGGGLRKMRWALPGRGKSGGARVIYFWFVAQSVIYLLSIYAKNEQEDLTPEQLKLLRKTVEVEFK
jgi:hypothetical protein